MCEITTTTTSAGRARETTGQCNAEILASASATATAYLVDIEGNDDQSIHDTDDDNDIENDDDPSGGNGCCSSILHYETILCATGSAWGLLDGQPTSYFVLWWTMRHIVYFGVAIGLLLLGYVYVVTAIFIGAHAYKAIRQLWVSVPPPPPPTSTSRNITKETTASVVQDESSSSVVKEKKERY
jgi:hypothetical protein